MVAEEIVLYPEEELHSPGDIASDSRARGPWLDPRSVHYFHFPLLSFKTGICQLLVKVCAFSTG